jgi:hypothetical protein
VITIFVPNFADFQNFKNYLPKNLKFLVFFHHSLVKAILFKYFQEHLHIFLFSPYTEQKMYNTVLTKITVIVMLLEEESFKLYG